MKVLFQLFQIVFLASLVKGDAVRLTEADFDVSIAGRPTVVMFGSKECGICKAWAPAFNEAADTWKDEIFQFVYVNCPDAMSICRKYGIQSYPEYLLFDEENPSGTKFMFNRDAHGYREWAEEQLIRTTRCTVTNDGAGCDERQKAFLDKWKQPGLNQVQEISRLQNMLNKPMSGDQKKWLFQRIAILKGIADTCEGETCSAS